MVSQKMQEAFNAQIQAELYSAYLYLAMSSSLEEQNFKGLAKWLRVQHGEELSHAYKLLDHLIERGGKAHLKTIESPPAEFGGPLSVFEQVLQHEQHVTARIHKLYEIATAEKDLAAQVFLQWFVTEQVEEESSAAEVLGKLKTVGDKSSGLLYLDKEFGKRDKD